MEKINRNGLHSLFTGFTGYRNEDTHSPDKKFDREIEDYKKQIEDKLAERMKIYTDNDTDKPSTPSHPRMRADTESYQIKLTVFSNDKTRQKKYIDHEYTRIVALIDSDIAAAEKKGKPNGANANRWRADQRAPIRTKGRSRVTGNPEEIQMLNQMLKRSGKRDPNSENKRRTSLKQENASPKSVDSNFSFGLPTPKFK